MLQIQLSTKLLELMNIAALNGLFSSKGLLTGLHNKRHDFPDIVIPKVLNQLDALKLMMLRKGDLAIVKDIETLIAGWVSEGIPLLGTPRNFIPTKDISLVNVEKISSNFVPAYDSKVKLTSSTFQPTNIKHTDSSFVSVDGGDTKHVSSSFISTAEQKDKGLKVRS